MGAAVSRLCACIKPFHTGQTRFVEGKEGAREALCNHCGGEASWSFPGEKESRVEVLSPDCGRFEMAREEFDQAEADMAGPEDRRE